ncbi:tetratricopeptide repeat protein [Basfia succiniciproducens]|uniref:tetratricopeptide repeat protein n=1 Tax=Basfia succiniciproducens TaxID=653940 RepID=UPI0008CA0F57|nr:c-type cytochrome biogenesis protein [Basfia succiniciproducens]SEQ45253.1 formate-dependent nitrite reductase complex subunit NrfG [Basfia succiniciproducens]
MTQFIIGLIIFAAIGLLLFVFFTKKVSWQQNYRQQQNIALYEQQLQSNPSEELANEFAQRLLMDEQQSEAALTLKSAVGFSRKLSALLWLVLVVMPLLYYFSLNRFDYVRQGEKAFAQQQSRLITASAEDKNIDYVLSIQNKLRKDPNNADDWVELGQAYMLSNDYDNALLAYGNAEKLEGGKPHILGLAATTLYYQAGQKITPQVQHLIDIALAADPKEVSSLSLMASDAFLKNDFPSALQYWQQLLDSGHTGIDRREIIRNMNLATMLQNNRMQQKAN